MTKPPWLATITDSLGVPLNSAVRLPHRGQGRVAHIANVGVAKVYMRESKKLRTAIGAANELSKAHLHIAPRLISCVDLDETEVALIFEHVEGARLPAGFLSARSRRWDLAHLLSELHTIRGSGFSRDPFGDSKRHSDWRTFVFSLLETATDRYVNRVGAAPPKFLADAVHATRAFGEARHDQLATAAPALVHRDITVQNLLLGKGDVLWLVDFDLAAFYDPLFDLVKLELFRNTAPRAWRELVNVYCSVSAIDTEAAMDRIHFARALELIWGYPALLESGSKAGRLWETRLEALARTNG